MQRRSEIADGFFGQAALHLHVAVLDPRQRMRRVERNSLIEIAEGFIEIALAITDDRAVVPGVRQFRVGGYGQIEIGERTINVAFG